MSLPWFRLYTEFVTDAKIQLLAFEDQRHYVCILCLKGKGDLDASYANDSYRERVIAKYLGLDPNAAAEAKRRLAEVGLIDVSWQPQKWDARQFSSDSSTDRVRRFRDKQKNGNGHETLLKRHANGVDTDSETDTESDSDSEKTCAAGGRVKNEAEPSKVDPPPLTLVPREASDDTDHDWFLDFKLAMPDRAGDPNWSGAKRAANARMREGHKPVDFIAGAQRYKIFCDATDATGTQYVKTAAAFLGPDKHFLKAWTPPKNKAARRLDANVDVMNQFVNGGGT